MHSIEESFIANFVQKQKRERALFELSSTSRRGKLLNRLCHDFSSVFESRFLRPIHKIDGTGLLVLLKQSGAKEMCHVISCNEAVDGRELGLQEGIQATFGFGLPSILICIPDKLAYFEAEQEKGPPPRYLLVK